MAVDADSSTSLPSPASAVTPVRSVVRAVDILLALSDGAEQLGDVAAGVDLSKATTYRILNTLRMRGMVLQGENGEYRLGPGCFRLISSLVDRRAGFPFDAMANLRDLRESTLETVTVHVRAGQARICIEELPSPQVIRYTAGLGATAGIHVGSAGKILLAYLPETELSELLAALQMRPMTDHTITDVDALRRELATVREQGIAFSDGERVSGAMGVSAPVTDTSGRVIAALSVLAPAARVDAAKRAEFGHLVAATAADISARILP